MKTKEFKVAMNPAFLYFELFYAVYAVYMCFQNDLAAAVVIVVVGILILGYLNLLRPYKYVIDRKTLTLKRRLGKSKEVNIMTCETICDPIPKMTKIIISPRAYEIYLEGGKRLLVTPKDRMGFAEAIVAANKRIHVQIKEYAATHRSYEKKRKRQLKEEAK